MLFQSGVSGVIAQNRVDKATAKDRGFAEQNLTVQASRLRAELVASWLLAMPLHHQVHLMEKLWEIPRSEVG